jgi:acetylornithine deacetylase/succinyl-diaminopimelate desuccinylase-like protein
MTLDAALQHARDNRDRAVADLVEELRIPSVSTLPEHRDDCRRNAEWLIERFQAMGFDTSLTDVVENGHPVLRADWTGRPGAPVLTIYGHYDVQPPDPLDLWTSPPFEPRIEGDVLFARGCADNKGNHMAALKAVESWIAVGGPPVNVRFLIEGEEEIGGESLPIYVREHASELDTACVVLWDGGLSSDNNPALCVGLRGMLYFDLHVQGASHDLHSGGYGGVAPNACDALATILAALHDDDRRVTVPGFYEGVRIPSDEETADWHRDPDGEARFKELMGVDALPGETGYGIEERLWTRPTLEVNGFIGGFTGEGAKTVIAAEASAKVSMRLVPDQDPVAIAKSFDMYLQELAPPGTKVSLHPIKQTVAPAVLLGADHAPARAARAAWEAATGKRSVVVRSGGSIPVATAFAEALDTELIISGVASKDCNAHAPDEKLYLENYYGGIDMMIRFMQGLADAGS